MTERTGVEQLIDSLSDDASDAIIAASENALFFAGIDSDAIYVDHAEIRMAVDAVVNDVFGSVRELICDIEEELLEALDPASDDPLSPEERYQYALLGIVQKLGIDIPGIEVFGDEAPMPRESQEDRDDEQEASDDRNELLGYRGDAV